MLKHVDGPPTLEGEDFINLFEQAAVLSASPEGTTGNIARLDELSQLAANQFLERLVKVETIDPDVRPITRRDTIQNPQVRTSGVGFRPQQIGTSVHVSSIQTKTAFGRLTEVDLAKGSFTVRRVELDSHPRRSNTFEVSVLDPTIEPRVSVEFVPEEQANN